VRDKIKEPFVDLGEQTLKNIARPMRVFTLKRASAWCGRARGEKAGLSSGAKCNPRRH
jgi:class 3 adenylate cyclase